MMREGSIDVYNFFFFFFFFGYHRH